MHVCQQCGATHHCDDILDYLWTTAPTLPPRATMEICPFHENQGARALWTCPTCTSGSWRQTILPYLRNSIIMGAGVIMQGAGPLPEGARRCGCNNCALR